MKKLICQKNIYPSKISLCYNTLLSRTFDENNYNNFFNNGFNQYFSDPIKNLLSDYEEIKTTLNIKFHQYSSFYSLLGIKLIL